MGLDRPLGRVCVSGGCAVGMESPFGRVSIFK